MSRENITVSIPSKLVEEIEDFIFENRKIIPRENRKKLNKTSFFELLLENAFLDYENKKEKSFLGKLIAKLSRKNG